MTTGKYYCLVKATVKQIKGCLLLITTFYDNIQVVVLMSCLPFYFFFQLLVRPDTSSPSAVGRNRSYYIL